jgi:threonine dehydrogenase-like Zn-dependent dehydrogenase
LGFTTFDPTAPDFNDNLLGITENLGFDVVFEVSGSRNGIGTAIDYAKITGTVMIIGMTSEPYPVNLSKIFQKELILRGVRVHSQINFIGALELLKNGKINNELQALISAVYPLKNVEEAFAFAQSNGDFFKILISAG